MSDQTGTGDIVNKPDKIPSFAQKMYRAADSGTGLLSPRTAYIYRPVPHIFLIMVTNYRSNGQKPLKNPKKPANGKKPKSIRHRGGHFNKFDIFSFLGSKKHDNGKAPTMVTAEALYQVMVKKENWTDSWSSFKERIAHLESLRLIDTYKRDLPNGKQVTEIVLRYDAKDVKEACENADHEFTGRLVK